ncbi:ATP-dependent DNA ligase [Dactylosporangium roseum]|uniref:DNA ligase (ATP) n=2 Tax=Dactylosporangium roseum TaxID=47989 RepID=A0ABY5Z8G9_9ACTN|nr:ATP-dependent DNA ligase [Dactylosporangium roseum]UWZ38376.1 ATP-dependent DNA ligase [Dactylosporangium roseum]
MELPVLPPVEPMLAKSIPSLPSAPGTSYEPKWDGFRCIVFRDGDEVELASRGGKTLTRYFPEVVDQVRAQLPERCVVDGEIIVIRRDSGAPRLDFELLGQRIHPAASRVRILAEHTPASFVAFDLLALGDESLMEQGYAKRRVALVEALAAVRPPVHVTPVTTDLDTARDWFERFEGAGLDGVIAKPADGVYEPGKRTMFKIKHTRTADVVVAGYRWHKDGPIVGSLLLGLYDDEGRLHHVGVSASFTRQRRAELVEELAQYRENIVDHPWNWAGQEPGSAATSIDSVPAGDAATRLPGGVSRWTGKKDLSFVPLRPELVVEVGYDAMEGDRFRHTAQFKRWRPDRDPRSCTYEQLDLPVRFDVESVLAGRP